MLVSQRRYDIDWLRVIAIGLLLIYHIAIGFQPWGVFIGFIQNSDSLESIWIPMSMLNVWRIPLLFFVSGMGVCFAMGRRSWSELLAERSKRILFPFIFGVLVVVPCHVFLWQDYYSQDIAYDFNPAHLWFLGNIFIYVLVLSPIFYYWKKNPKNKVQQFLQQIFNSPIGLLLITLPFVIEALLVDPVMFEMYAMTSHGFWLGLLAFFFGFCLVYAGDAFWKTVLQWRWLLLVLAFGMYIIRLLFFELEGPGYMKSIESNLWIFTVFGFGHKYLNRPGKVLNYLSQAAYPVYIIHMAFLYLASFLLFEMQLPVLIKFLFVVGFTFLGCFLSYEYLIRRVNWLRACFGLNRTSK